MGVGMCLTRYLTFLLAASLVAATVGVEASGQSRAHEDQRFDSGEGNNLDRFGEAIAMDADVAVIGTPGLDGGGTNSGAAYIYRKVAGLWVQEQRLEPAVPQASAAFGTAVAILGDVLAIGAPGDSEAALAAGAVFTFRYDGAQWVQEQKLIAPDAEPLDGLGTVVGVSEDVVLAATDNRDLGFQDNVGAVYVFRHDGVSWSQDQILTASDAAGWDFFGWSLAVRGDTAVVGAMGEDAGGIDRGSAYVFHQAGLTWTETDKLTAASGENDDQLGFSVAVATTEDLIVVGANTRDEGASNTGAAYVFRDDGVGWKEEAQLLGSDTEAFDHFGSCVAIDADLALVYASLDDEAGTNSGATFLFRWTGGAWVEQAKLIGNDTLNTHHFGEGLALVGNTAMVGATGVSASRGAVYAFDLPEISLDAQANVVQLGDPLDLYTCGGVPFNPVVLFVLEVNGAPLAQLLFAGLFDIDGRFHQSFNVPQLPQLEGLDLTLHSFSLDRLGKPADSRNEVLSIQE